MNLERAIIYVDGFNLYFGAVKGTAFKWLDLQKLCRRILRPTDELVAIRYYTALITARPRDPDGPVRQQMYLRALSTIPILSLHYGHFLSHPVRMPLAATVLNENVKYAEVMKTEEKGSDVNLASHLLRDAYTDKFSVAVIVSNDSDLVEPIRIVREELGKRVGILNPHPIPSVSLRRNADFFKGIRKSALRQSQFPETMQDEHGTFHKPSAW